MIYHSPMPPVPLTGQTITERVLDGLSVRPDETVIVDGPSGRGMTARDLTLGITRLAGGLVARGMARGEVTAILAPNLPDYAIACHGPLYAGGTVTTINPAYTAPEVHHQLADTGATRLITIPELLANARAAAVGTEVTNIAVIGTPDDASDAPHLSDWMADPLPAQVPVEVTGHVAVLPYSSGTTGLPKGVMLTHRNLVVNIDQVQPAIAVQPGDRTVAFLPFFHIYGLSLLINHHLAHGARLVKMPRFDLALFLRLCQDYRARQSSSPRPWPLRWPSIRWSRITICPPQGG